MFDSKKQTLFSGTNTPKKTTSAFVKAGLENSAKTNSLGNGATKYTTTNNDFVDQFGNMSNYKKERSYAEIDADMRLLYSQNPLNAVKFLFYARLITRQVQLPNGSKTETTQRGQGLKNEGIFRMMWLGINKPEVFKENLPLFISVGSWKDVFTMLSFDLQYNGWEGRKLDWSFLGKVILSGLENPNSSELVKKYLPQIKSKAKCTTLESQADTIIGKWVCSLLFGGKENDYSKYKNYRKLKTSGTAHQWQQLISQKNLLSLDFKSIAGRALAQLVSSKFLSNQKLTAEYEAWISTQPIAKYTGYVYELMSKVKKDRTNLPLTSYQEKTINAQFLGLIETARNGMSDTDSGLICVVDSSGSMMSDVPGTKISSYDVAKSMALYFSYLLKGSFEGAWMEFSRTTIMKTWKGSTPVDKLRNDNASYVGDTNFAGVADEFARIKRSGVPESEFPNGIVCISDGCFNSTAGNKTETQALKQRLLSAGFSKEYVDNFKIVLWDIPNGYYGGKQTAFEGFADTPNLFHMSGFDGSGIAFLTGTTKQLSTPKTSEELFEAAMDQECLNLIKIK